ncbi:uncharacterized protein C8A04DRAFT_26867 [Dichotomopilus funicola]|uniref:Uncharacterized protein n=1 Tax=Dichotomopilus funicola TaxID=1934379 RepID=A0AAN6V5W4_9PEZI|nr:hypothetical protein C8A04DRAFT_26867 [Dichotomopilus funicola]
MPELILQSARAATDNKNLIAEAAQIQSTCRDQHPDTEALLACPQCYGAVLEAFRAHFSGLISDGQQQPWQRKWFTSRSQFLSEVNALIDSAKKYQIPPSVIDDRVQAERSWWYTERVRVSLLRLMVEDPASRDAVLEKLEDLPAEADPVTLAREVAEILTKGRFAEGDGTATELLAELAAADADPTKSGNVLLTDALFKTEDGTVPEDHQKYLDMLLQQGLSMEQVVDRILDERQTAIGAREQTDKLDQRLDELRRARAAHEAQKTRKAQRRESLAQQKLPDELYELPDCAVCGDAPRTEDYLTCSVCAILAAAGARAGQTVFCSERCERQGHIPHAETHTCSSGADCIQLHQPPHPHSHDLPNGKNDSSSSSQQPQDTNGDIPMTDAPPTPRTPLPPPAAAPPSSSSPYPPSQPPQTILFCTECLTTFHQPILWCSPACADANFQSHREGVHLPERKRLGDSDAAAEAVDEAQLEYYPVPPAQNGEDAAGAAAGGSGGETGTGIENGSANTSEGRKYHAKDITAVTTSLEEATREWEEKTKVRLQGLD